MHMHNGYNDNQVFTYLVNHCIRETVSEAATSTVRQRTPCMGIIQDAVDGTIHLIGEFKSKARTVSVIEINRSFKLRLGYFQYPELHRRLIRSRDSSSDKAAILPLSNASMRCSASLAQAVSTAVRD